MARITVDTTGMQVGDALAWTEARPLWQRALGVFWWPWLSRLRTREEMLITKVVSSTEIEVAPRRRNSQQSTAQG